MTQAGGGFRREGQGGREGRKEGEGVEDTDAAAAITNRMLLTQPSERIRAQRVVHGGVVPLRILLLSHLCKLVEKVGAARKLLRINKREK